MELSRFIKTYDGAVPEEKRYVSTQLNCLMSKMIKKTGTEMVVLSSHSLISLSFLIRKKIKRTVVTGTSYSMH